MARDRHNRGISLTDRRLPITTRVVSGLISLWATPTKCTFDPAVIFDNTMLKAVATLSFFDFFRSREITVPYIHIRGMAPSCLGRHCSGLPAVIKVHLKRLKCDQLGHGVDVFIGRTGTALYPVTAILAYVEK